MWKLWYVVGRSAGRDEANPVPPPLFFQAAAWRRNPGFYHNPMSGLGGQGGVPHPGGGLCDRERGVAYVHSLQCHRGLSEADERNTRLGYPGRGADTKGRETGAVLEEREQVGLGLAGAGRRTP